MLQDHRNLFGDDPCGRYGELLLNGQTAEIQKLREELEITDGTWFMRKLYLSQVRAILSKPDQAYLSLLPRLIQLLLDNSSITDEGLALTVNRHARLPSPPISSELREMARDLWGHPERPTKKAHWHRVSEPAKAMLTKWLMLEFIRDFFTLLAEDGQGDTRRLDFWQRYVSEVKGIHFALGSEARESTSSDFVAMRKRMEGFTIPLLAPVRTNNAFIMRIGALVLVEFSGFSNACYGYDASVVLPFELDGRPLTMPIDAANSLKSSRRVLWLQHQDEIRGFATWEERFEAELAAHGIYPGAGPSISTSRSAQAARTSVGDDLARVARPSVPTPATALSPNEQLLRRQLLNRFAKALGLKIVDLTPQGGALWVRTHDANNHVNETLRAWGFRYKDPHKGWWLDPP